MNFANMMDYHHFPIYSIMVLFLGAFIASVCQPASPRRTSRTPPARAPGSRCWPRR